MLDTEFFQKYSDKGISTIPVRKMYDEKKGIYSGKYPAIKGWDKFCKEVPDEDDIAPWGRISNCSGIAFVTGEASNLACIDLDTEDPDLAEKIVRILPYTPCRIIGHPKRYGKLLYRVSDFPESFEWEGIQPKKQIKRGKEVVADVFMGNAYIVAPPSLHSQSQDEVNSVYYRWHDEQKSLETVGIENLPVIPKDAVYKIQMAVDGVSRKSIELVGAEDQESISEKGGRYNAMVNYASTLIRTRAPMEKAVNDLIEIDKKSFPNNRYFKDASKGNTHQDVILNAIKFYADMLMNCNKNGISEVPRMLESREPLYLEEWAQIIPLEEERKELDIFNEMLVPEAWRKMIMEVANANGIPPEGCFYLLLTSLSAVIGNKRVIVPKHQNKSWEEAFNIWTIYVSPSGTRKTQMLKTLTRYINALQSEIDKEHGEYSARKMNEKQVNDTRIKFIEKQLQKEVENSVAENDGKVTPATEREITILQDRLTQIREYAEIVPKRQLVVKSATTEKLIEILAANKTGTFLEYNELSELTQTFKKKGYESLRTLLLDSWDGLRPYSYQTKGSGEAFIEQNCSSLYASVQTSVFEHELTEIANNINDDGFYQRSFIVLNENPVAMAIDEEFSITEYAGIFETFANAENMASVGEKVTTTNEAYTIMLAFEQKMLDMAKLETISALSSFWGKFTGKVVKVAGLLEYIKVGNEIKRISFESMETAIALMNRQITHIQNMFPNPVYIHAREVLRLVKLGVIQDGVTHDKIVKLYRPLADSTMCSDVMTLLYRHNSLDMLTRDFKVFYYFNPASKSPQ